MANNFLTTDLVTKAVMARFQNESVMCKKVRRDLDEAFEGKIGYTVKIRKPIYFTSHTAADISSNINDITEGYSLVTLDKRRVVAFDLESDDKLLNVEDLDSRLAKPAARRLVADVETAIAGLYKKVWNITGTPGTTPATFDHLNENSIVLDELGVDMYDRCAFLTPKTSGSLTGGLVAVFPQKIATKAIEKAFVREYAGFAMYKTPVLSTHTTGAYTTGSTPLVDGAAQIVTYLAAKDTYEMTFDIKGFANSTAVFKEGDTFTIADVFSLNTETSESTGRLQSFVVRADGSSDGSGLITTTISPPIITAGAHATVDAAPADGAAITMTSGTESTAYKQNMLWHPDAITLAFGQLTQPDGSVQSSRINEDSISIRYVIDYNGQTDVSTHRFDILFAAELTNPGFAVRMTE